ncbi:DUF397 domain-containing protein [Actinomadura sp. 6N118]|uniref:DUF397 domain-containing protein n=1 Tax=Actinomadura sp. 6N118 TaxID=3375151 RepID=UPI0037BA20FD
MDVTTAGWRKSSRSNETGHCVELARLAPDEVGVRDSKKPDAGYITLSTSVFRALAAKLKE